MSEKETFVVTISKSDLINRAKTLEREVKTGSIYGHKNLQLARDTVGYTGDLYELSIEKLKQYNQILSNLK